MESQYRPLVSIIIPVYKVEDYIGKCIESLQNQTYSNLQIILIEDCSPDDSGQICDDYAAKDDRITVIHHERNMGVSKTRNDGLAIVKGEYIAFVDGDDYVAPSMIEDCLFTIQKEQVDVVVFDIGVLENGTIIPRHMDERYFVNIKSAYTALIEDKIPNYLCNKFFKAIAWKEIRLKENTDFEDLMIMSLVFKNLSSVYYLQKALYFYNCDNENSITSNWSSKSKYGLFCSYLYRQPLAEELEMTEFVSYCCHRAIRSAVGGIGLNLAKPELQDKQVEHMLDYLKQEEQSSDMPPIGAKYQLLLYGALHAPIISKIYGHMMFSLERIKKIFN